MRRSPPIQFTNTILITSAFILTFFAQFLFTGEIFSHQKDSNPWEWFPQYSIALVCLFTALCIAGLAAWRQREAASWEAEQLPADHISIRPTWSVVVITSISCMLANACYYWLGESSDLRWFWIGTWFFFIGGLWKVLPPNKQARLTKFDWLAMAIITTIAIFLRFWELNKLPDQLDNDVYWIGTAARSLVESNNYNWFGFSIPAGHLQSYAQFHAWGLRFFGNTRTGLVIGSAITGTLTIPVIYLLGRELFSQRVAVLAALFLTWSYTHIHFSRTMFGPTSTLFATLTFLFIARGLRRGDSLWFALAGLTAGIGLLFYDSSRVIPLIMLFVALWALIWRRDLLLLHRFHLLLFVIGVAIGFGPNTIYAITHYSLFQGRSAEVVLWAPQVWEHQSNFYNTDNPLHVVLNQIARVFLTFYLYGDRSPQFGFQRPLLMPLTAAFFTIGVGAAFSSIRQIRFFTLLIWIILTFITGGVITYDPPFWPHLLIALPAIVILAAYGADRLFQQIINIVPQRLISHSYAIFGVIILLSGFEAWRIYIDFTKNNAGPRTYISRIISALPGDYTVYFISEDLTPDMFIFQFYNRHVPIQKLTPDQIDDLPRIDKPQLFIVHHHNEILDELQAQFDNGVVESYMDRNNQELFTTYRVGPPLTIDPKNILTTSFDWVYILLLGMGIGWISNILWQRQQLQP